MPTYYLENCKTIYYKGGTGYRQAGNNEYRYHGSYLDNTLRVMDTAIADKD